MTRALKVLLVDDDEDIRAIGEMALTEVGGMQTVLASSGAAALGLAAREQPDVVLLDVMMPGLDGPTTFRRLRDDPSTAAIPVVFVTAKVQRSEVERYVEMGAAGVIGKPFDPMRLPDDVRAILDKTGGEAPRA
ncbi:response regulator [Paraliomyxa miuraensis]|uniref:response regulator n=1 Tax=Paraliomyxa miuraensis TaxID=376150 RepID=UPI0022561D4C|nr:response regulator [Paraliomyxa miuraensis]MCX4246665.1 response regulator [Paraliomyxa miuraensis]